MFFNIHTHCFDEKSVCVLNCTPDDYREKQQAYPFELMSLGIHPQNIKKDISNELYFLKEQIHEQNVVAVGECGLDIYADVERQENIFIRQIEISETCRKPVIIHCVKMHNELIRLKKRYNPKMPWIIHGYRGNEHITEQLLVHDFYLSYGKNIHSKSLQMTPLDRIFFETDDADISISTVYKNAAEVLQSASEDLCRRIENNFKNVFRSNI